MNVDPDSYTGKPMPGRISAFGVALLWLLKELRFQKFIIDRMFASILCLIPLREGAETLTELRNHTFSQRPRLKQSGREARALPSSTG